MYAVGTLFVSVCVSARIRTSSLISVYFKKFFYVSSLMLRSQAHATEILVSAAAHGNAWSRLCGSTSSIATIPATKRAIKDISLSVNLRKP